MNKKDITGKRFGVLTVKLPTYLRQNDNVVWECLCDCGNMVLIRRDNLLSGNSKSCGCVKEVGKLKHGEACKTKEYDAWVQMRHRCRNKNLEDFKYYGGRGITVCDEWKTDYSQFLADVGRAPSKDHSIDRIDNNGNYEPSNVRWVTQLEQVHNSRRSMQGGEVCTLAP